jgi:hypothetical protein
MLAQLQPAALQGTLRRRCVARASSLSGEPAAFHLSRRETLQAMVAAPLFGVSAVRADEEFTTFYGAANPPATYGGVGGTTKDKARYSFSVPAGWAEDVVSKTEKGATGVDSRFLGPKRTRARVYVVTLAPMGSRDGSGFVAKDGESALKAVTGGDFALQDVLAAGKLTVTATPGGGFRYELDGPTCASPCSIS